MAKPSRYCALTLITIGTFVLSAIAFSEFVLRDRFFSCDNGFAHPVATALIEGKSVAFATNDFPDKCIVAAVIGAMPTSPDTVAIGSSRTMQLGSELFEGSFYNASVFAARLYDYLGLVQLMETHQRLPKRLIIGVDLWAIDQRDDDPRWGGMALEAGAFIAGAASTGKRVGPNLVALGRLFLSYVTAALRRLGGHIGVGELRRTLAFVGSCYCLNPFAAGMEVLDQPTSDSLVKRSDGFIIYERKIRDRNRDALNIDGLASATAYVSTPHALSSHYLDQLWQLTRYLQTRGVEPIIWLAPFGPTEYRLMVAAPNGQIVRDAERELRRSASTRQIRVVGSYNPANIPCQQDEFIDWQHPDKRCVARAFGRD